MTDSPTKYRAIPSSEDEARAVGDEYYSTSERMPPKARIRWMYFLLGCAILLPWHGDTCRQTTHLCLCSCLLSYGKFDAVFLVPTGRFPLHPDLQFVLVKRLHMDQISLPVLLHIHFETGSYISLMGDILENSPVRMSQSSPSRRILASITAMILLVISLCLSTFIRGTPSTFFAFALFNAASLAVATGYLSIPVYAGAALFGTSFLQAVLSGQGATGVVVSAVQVVSSMIALWGSSSKYVSIETIRAEGREDQVEEIAARIFFGVSAICLGIVLIAYAWLARQSFYRTITSGQHRRIGDPDERTALVADHRRNFWTEPNLQVYQVFRQNLIFMFSLAYVFAVTLVGAHLIVVIALQLIL